MTLDNVRKVCLGVGGFEVHAHKRGSLELDFAGEAA